MAAVVAAVAGKQVGLVVAVGKLAEVAAEV